MIPPLEVDMSDMDEVIAYMLEHFDEDPVDPLQAFREKLKRVHEIVPNILAQQAQAQQGLAPHIQNIEKQDPLQGVADKLKQQKENLEIKRIRMSILRQALLQAQEDLKTKKITHEQLSGLVKELERAYKTVPANYPHQNEWLHAASIGNQLLSHYLSR